MPRGTFSADYDHTFPSRAMVKYPAGWSGPVKDEVATAAIAAGKFKPDGDGDEKRGPGRPRKETLPGNLPPELAEPQALTPNLHNTEHSD
jgi:hypothetical protein